MNGPQITVVGNVGSTPRLRSLASGTLVTDFRVAMTPSRFDKTTEAWVDLETLWFSVSCWRALGEHAAMSFNKGDKVIVTGTLSTRAWTDKEGVPRTSMEIDASSVGLDLTRGPVLQKRIERTPEAAPDQPVDEWQDAATDADPLTGEALPERATPDQVAA